MRKKRLFLVITVISLLLVGSIGQSAALAEPISGPFEDIWNSINTLFQKDEGQQDQIDALQAQSDQQAALISELRAELDTQKEKTALLEEKVEPMEIVVQEFFPLMLLTNNLLNETQLIRAEIYGYQDQINALNNGHENFETQIDGILWDLYDLQNQINDLAGEPNYPVP